MAKNQQDIGISAFGFAIPSYALPLQELAGLRDIGADKYLDGLGCHFMSLCKPGETVATLAVNAAKRAISNWQGDIATIGMVVVATESSFDMSRPLSSWVMQELGLSGQIRSYEVKHACYGGAVALRQAIEWKLAGNSKGKVALVIAADVAMYAINHSGEPTQGAGAVAMIVDTPTIASIDSESYYWSEPRFDFWRPVGNKYPEVNGRLSLSCYINAVIQCFSQLAPKNELTNYLREYALICCHVPFPKMVYKAIRKLGEYSGLNPDEIETLYNNKIFTTMRWNQQIGNSYTASLWFAVANALTKTAANEKIIAFSYGSGCGSELMTLRCTENQANAIWVQQLEQDLLQRQIIDAEHYQELRKEYELII